MHGYSPHQTSFLALYCTCAMALKRYTLGQQLRTMGHFRNEDLCACSLWRRCTEIRIVHHQELPRIFPSLGVCASARLCRICLSEGLLQTTARA